MARWWWISALLLGGCAIGRYETDETRGWFDGESVRCPDLSNGSAALSRVPGPYCIDETEVTRKQYFEWLESNPERDGELLASLPARCEETGEGGASGRGWASGRGGASGADGASARFDPRAPARYYDCWAKVDPLGGDDLPIVCVNWCDAYAYCKDNGKVLCGTHDGKAVPWNDHDTPEVSQWYNACVLGDDLFFRYRYPYGRVYNQAKCNVEDQDLQAVRSNTWCTAPKDSSYEGVYDLIGNAAEWVNSCDDEGDTEVCWVRGGAAGDPSKPEGLAPERMNCKSGRSQQFDASQDKTGFRCCWVPPAKK